MILHVLVSRFVLVFRLHWVYLVIILHEITLSNILVSAILIEGGWWKVTLISPTILVRWQWSKYLWSFRWNISMNEKMKNKKGLKLYNSLKIPYQREYKLRPVSTFNVHIKKIYEHMCYWWRFFMRYFIPLPYSLFFQAPMKKYCNYSSNYKLVMI